MQIQMGQSAIFEIAQGPVTIRMETSNVLFKLISSIFHNKDQIE